MLIDGRATLPSRLLKDRTISRANIEATMKTRHHIGLLQTTIRVSVIMDHASRLCNDPAHGGAHLVRLVACVMHCIEDYSRRIVCLCSFTGVYLSLSACPFVSLPVCLSVCRICVFYFGINEDVSALNGNISLHTLLIPLILTKSYFIQKNK
jgi:hypothetical protein